MLLFRIPGSDKYWVVTPPGYFGTDRQIVGNLKKIPSIATVLQFNSEAVRTDKRGVGEWWLNMYVALYQK
jgi:hypothetical protein